MIILHLIDVKNIQGNGVYSAVNEYLKYESKNNQVAIWDMCSCIEIENIESFYLDSYKRICDLPKPFNKPDIVVFNEVYKPKYIKIYKECKKHKIPYVIIPHGSLVKNAQQRHRGKKIIGNIVLFNKFIYNASAIQFLNQNEKKETYFKYKKAIICGNGTNIPQYTNQWKSSMNKDLVYIGRYEIKHKGLDLLVNMCCKYKQWFIDNNMHIQLYGRDSGNELTMLKQDISKNKIQDILIINKPVYHDEKENVLKNSYAFIQCSRYEGQPMGIIEALSVGLPCIVTEGTYMGDYIQEKKCGLVSTFNIDKVFENVRYIYTHEQEREKFANNSKKYSVVDYHWENVIANTIKQYKKI